MNLTKYYVLMAGEENRTVGRLCTALESSSPALRWRLIVFLLLGIGKSVGLSESEVSRFIVQGISYLI